LILEIDNISKTFGGVQALKKVNFNVSEGEIVGLIGPNGSGKTTLFNVITGFLKPTEGKIRFKGQDITGAKPNVVCHGGIARTFQIVKPFGDLTTLQNIMVGAIYGTKNKDSLHQIKLDSQKMLDMVGLRQKENAPAASLTLAGRKKLELGRALATKPQLLLLDEVMGGLNQTEIEDIMAYIKKLRASGITIILVEHIMKAVMGVSDRIIVLNVGEKIAEGTPQQIITNQQVIVAYLGEEAHA
jgi:branched-chain amino acid transport system ATP-binding protein